MFRPSFGEPRQLLKRVVFLTTGPTELLQEVVHDADVALCCHGRHRAAIGALAGAHSTPDGDLGALKRCLFEG